MTEHAICFQCIKDEHLREIVESKGEPLKCEVCGGKDANAFTYSQLGEELQLVIREHFHQGPTVKKFYDDDKEGWEQEGDSLAYVVQMVLGQDVEEEGKLVSAVIAAEHYYPGDGEDAFYDDTSLYVRRKATPHELTAEWQYLQEELAHRRRFFSESARVLFNRLFDGVPQLEVWDAEADAWAPVVYELPVGTHVSRARVVKSESQLRDIVNHPSRELGAPPAALSVSVRMNPNGIVVFYAAMDRETCLAEMRPPLGGRVLAGTFRTTLPIRVLDFRRLEKARLAELSYFDPQFASERERAVFLRRLHALISRPVIPGREDDYLITQTLSEYLAHIHQPLLDGVLFRSVQRAGGTNIVLFGRDGFEVGAQPDGDLAELPFPLLGAMMDSASPTLEFPVEFVQNSAKLFITRAIEYEHHEAWFSVHEGHVFVHDDDGDEGFDEDD